MTALLLLVFSLLQTPPAQPAAGEVDRGKELFMKHTCYYCHGTEGQGSGAGVRIALPTRTTESFIRYVRRPSGQMPAYTDKILSDRELTDIVAYLKSLPAAKPVKDIPLLSQIK
jgi:mono/diheme cytochrome c family protein